MGGAVAKVNTTLGTDSIAEAMLDPGGVLGMVTGESAREAAAEQDKRFEKAIEAAKEHEVRQTQAQTGTSTVDQTTQTKFAPKSKLEKQLQAESVASFRQQQKLAQQGERKIAARQGLQEQARGTLGGIISGEAFALSPEEQARIDRLTEAGLARGDERINRMLNERLGQLEADAARRGIRGQAFSQLQTGALETAAQEATAQQLAAEERAAQLGIELPGQRVGLQAQTAGGLATFADQARQQALENRAALQDPVALQQLRDERLRGGATQTTGTTGTTQQTTGVTKGQGVVDLMAAQAGSPGQGAAKAAGQAQALGTGAKIIGGIFGGGG